jgi:hypothetical protein
MIQIKNIAYLMMVCVVFFTACSSPSEQKNNTTNQDTTPQKKLTLKERLNQYANFALTTDLSKYSKQEKEMLSLLIDASKVMDDIFWLQAYGNKDTLFAKLKTPEEKEFCEINYGPWDRLNDNEPVINGVGKKPIGAGFYPSDIKYFPFIDMKFEDKLSMYTVIKRSDDGSLFTQPYHVAYEKYLKNAADLLKKAAKLSPDKAFANFLEKRADGLLTDDFYQSDILWVDLNSKYDLDIGPFEFEEDRFINSKTSYEAILMIKDMEWSKKFETYSKYLPEIKNSFSIPENYKSQIILANTNIGVYDAIYYAGWPNAGPKQISTNRPKDGRILMDKGGRKLQFKNSMKAKFDKILKPISDILIDKDERTNVKFEGFFINNVTYEIADAIMVKTTVNGKGAVKDALKDYFPTINSLKADILNMYILTQLQEKNVISDATLLDNYVIFIANVIRSVRFGAAFSQGSSNIMAFNMLYKMKAFTRNNTTGTYKVNSEKMKEIIIKLSKDILTVLAEGDYATAKSWVEIYGNMSPELQQDIQKISKAGIPTDIKFEQGKQVLGLQ